MTDPHLVKCEISIHSMFCCSIRKITTKKEVINVRRLMLQIHEVIYFLQSTKLCLCCGTGYGNENQQFLTFSDTNILNANKVRN